MEADRKGMGLPSQYQTKVIPPMIDNLDASSDQLRLAVARSFLTYKTETLIALLADENVIVRTSAARELQSRAGNQIFAAAAHGAEHSRFEMREISAFLLGQLGTPNCPYSEQSYPILLRLLDDPYHEVVAAAITGLGSLASLGHFASEQAFSAVSRLSTAPDIDVRTAVAFTLGFLKDKASRQVLSKLAEDQSALVRDTAEFSLELRSERNNSI